MAEMDGSAFSLLGLEDELSCSICLSPFDCPVTIPCGHNFCQDCLLATWKDSYSCPQCRTHFATKPELKKNTVLSTVVDTFRLRTSKTSEADVMVEDEEEEEVEVQDEKVKAIRCDACMEADASQTCLTCMASYCEEHLRPHRENPIFKVHQLIEPVGDLSERICPDHHKLMELFCSQHGRPICSLCLQQAHKGCPFMSPEEQRDRKESDLRGKLGLLEGQILKNENVLSQMSSMQNKLQDSATKKKATLAANYQQMRDMLAREEHEAQNTVDRELETNQTKLNGLVKKATDNVNTMSNAKDKIQGLLSQSQTPAFLKVSFNIPKVAKKDPSAPQINLNSKEMSSSQAFSFALKGHLTEILKQPVEARLHILKQGAKAAPGSAPASSGGTGSQPESEATKPQKQRRQPINQQWFQQGHPAGYIEANGPFYPPRFMGPQLRPGQKARPYGGGPPAGWFPPSGPQWAGPCPQPKMHPKKKPQKDNMGKKDQAHSMEGHLDFSGKEKPRGCSPAPESKETSASVVETSDIPPNITSAERRTELLKYGTVLTLDPKTAHKRIVLSEDSTKASVSDQPTDHPDCPERFAVCSQVLASQGFSRGRHYWEVRLSSSNFIGIGLAYGSIDRKGPTSRLGRNAQSWCIEWFNVKLSAWYNSSETVLVNPNPKRVGVLLDFEEGTATFYNVADRAYPFHSFVFPFAEHVYPAFWIFSSGSSVSLCKLQA